MAALLGTMSAAAFAADESAGLPVTGIGKHRLQANVGVASPVGEIGLSYTHAPIPLVELEIGAGLGFSGFQFAVTPKLSFGGSRHRVLVGLGPSLSVDTSGTSRGDHVGYWVNGEVGYERRTQTGFSMLVAAGFTYGLGGNLGEACTVDCGNDARIWDAPIAGRLYPQARIAFGRWF
jgi:hypothetical protein